MAEDKPDKAVTKDPEPAVKPESPSADRGDEQYGVYIKVGLPEASATCLNLRDDAGNPAGGSANAIGLVLKWQDGPLNREPNEDGQTEEPNGTFCETVVDVVINRLRFYQGSAFSCPENDEALEHLEAALDAMERRRADRTARGVLGKNEA